MTLSRATIFILLASFSNLAFAEACIQIGDDDERLECFDTARTCATIQSNSNRLACFDSAYSGDGSSNSQANLRNLPAELPSEADRSVDSSSDVQPSDNDELSESVEHATSPERFGLKTRPDIPEEYVEAAILDVKTNALKIDFLLLDNGHIWRENEDSRVRFKVGRKVVIENGILGSHNLTMEGTTKIIKVQRIK